MDSFDDIQTKLQEAIKGTKLEQLPTDMIAGISSSLSALRAKGHTSTAFCGHNGCGKSTLVDQMVFGLKGAPSAEKWHAEALKQDPPGSPLALYLADREAIRKSGKPVPPSSDFYTPTKHFQVWDAPNFRDFVKNLVASCNLDIAVLMVPADESFAQAIAEATPRGPLLGQSRSNAHILKLLGVKQLIVAVNKIDLVLENQEARFKEVCEETSQMLIKLGFPQDFVGQCVPKIPISAKNGDNLLTQSSNLPWWQGTEIKVRGTTLCVKTLVDALESMAVPAKPNNDAPLRVPISAVYKIKDIGDVLTGRVEQGILRPGSEVKFLPLHSETVNCSGSVVSTEIAFKEVPFAEPGDNCAFHMDGLAACNARPALGHVMTLKSDPLRACKSFTAQVTTLLPPGELRVGYSPLVCIRTAKVACKMAKINWKMVDGQQTPNPIGFKANEIGEVVFQPIKPFVVDTFENCEGLGRFAVMDIQFVVMIGIITEVQYD